MWDREDMAKKNHGVGTPALVALTKAGMAFVEHAYEHDPAQTHFGDETAAALGVDKARLFKTLLAQTDRGLVVGIVPVSGQLDLKALAKACGVKKAEMADPAAAERATGYLVGGISPLGQKSRLPMILDDSALGHDTIYVSGGRRGLQVELSATDLVRVTGARVAAIGR